MTRPRRPPDKFPGKPLPASFYARPTVEVARDLLGAVLAHRSPQGLAAGRIVETEAYLCDDPACHAARGPTRRNQAMFGPPGRSYIYLIYGMYHCFNVVTSPRGVGEAVLIRALEPVAGLDLMARRRGTDSPKALCSGPGKLVIALGIAGVPDGSDLRKGPLAILPAESFPRPAGDGATSMIPRAVKVTTRIGITQAAHLPLRFYLEGNPFISKK
ncbi:MAG TPA: DNA-3-methyladenine glycosylase [Fibrobacteria bacterium]|nr:DNA-3-methyladenine glycosylase [Fibrobacteria bacterium]